jgi:hypothetical protein
LNSGGLKKETEQVVQLLTTRFPRNIFARTVQYESFSDTAEEKAKVVNILKDIDPILGLCYESDAPEGIRRLLEGLQSSQKYELARGWGVLPSGRSTSGENFQWSQVDQVTLTAKIAAFCVSS